MVRKITTLKTLALTLIATAVVSCGGKRELADYVDPFIGTDAHGHTYPGATVPFGLVQLSPDTDTQGWDWCSGYHSSDNSIMGFSHSHLSGTGGADLGDILIMPGLGEVKFTAGSKENPTTGYRSRFNHGTEKASAGYYSVFLDDVGVKAELTAAAHTGVHRYRFDNPEEQYMIIDLDHGIQDNSNNGFIRLVNDTVIEGSRRSNGWADDHTVYFYAVFGEPIARMDVSYKGNVESNVKEAEHTSLVAAIFFQNPEREINVKVGISYVDMQGAKQNYIKEAQGKTFDQLHTEARNTWNSELSKVSVEGDENDKTIFYTALYHSMLAPFGMSDVDGRYIGSDRNIHTDKNNVNYGLFSLWDTFRALHPLMTIIDPAKNQEFIQSLVRYYQQSGRLPVWDLNMRENNCMIGYHSVPVIVDAYMKGQRDFDTQKAMEAMIHSAMQEDYAGVQYYRDFGYLPTDKENNAVSKALEYAYDDWCIAQMAKDMGMDSIYQVFSKRAQYYKNHLDEKDGFMKGRNSQGALRTPFSPTEISILGQGDFTEGNSWHYSFFVPQDVNTHIQLLGGDEAYVAKLDEMFNSESVTADHSPDVTGLIGNYAQGNEPSHHAAYLYNYAGQPWKTQEKIAQIKKEMYTSARDGLCGNEDCGQMSAWYVFSAMGFYPVTPGANIYALGTPTFEKLTLTQPSGNDFVVLAENVNNNNIYIQSATWNDEPYTKSYITHDMIANGGTLTLKMGSTPNKEFGAKTEDRPISQITEFVQTSEEMLADIVFEPFLLEAERIMNGSIVVTPKQHNNQKIVYTLDGSKPTAYSARAGETITVYGDRVLKIRSVSDEGKLSSVGTYKFYNGRLGEGLKLSGTEADKPYNEGGLAKLSDGLTGGANYKDSNWLGFVGKDIILNLELDAPRFVSGVGFNAINAPGAWLLLPFGASANYYNSDKLIKTTTIDVPASNQTNDGDHYFKLPGGVMADKVVLTLTGGVLPQWHTSKGNGAWIFLDEVTLF